MLRYLGLGKRHYGRHPMPPHPRLNWEFLAVVRGKIAPYEKSQTESLPVANQLWLYPPGTVHGWAGERGKTCELVVAHYSTVPPAVERLATKYGRLECRLGAQDVVQLRKLAQVLKGHYWHPTLESELQAERALMDLCLLVLRNYAERHQTESTGGSHSRVVAAENWLRARLSERPSIKEAAQAVGLSVSQLFRLFQRVRNESPQDALNRMKIDQAMALLGGSNAKLDKIAAECGFSNASNLCRAFKSAKGRSPSAWRKETFIQYKRARSKVVGDHTQHGRRVREPL